MARVASREPEGYRGDLIADVIRRLEERTEGVRRRDGAHLACFAERHDLMDWEGWFSPYDRETYETVISQIAPGDVVIDIGAGDLRLALRMAGTAHRVYAVEINPLVVARALETIGLVLPRNVQVTCANALDFPIPAGVTVGVLLMRHCQHFGTYAQRLVTAGCRLLLTNARWRTGVEAIDLTTHGMSFDGLEEGWYACRCGAVGYVGTGTRSNALPMDVASCPSCSDSTSTAGG